MTQTRRGVEVTWTQSEDAVVEDVRGSMPALLCASSARYFADVRAAFSMRSPEINLRGTIASPSSLRRRGAPHYTRGDLEASPSPTCILRA